MVPEIFCARSGEDRAAIRITRKPMLLKRLENLEIGPRE
jgi:hypothetical protein